jgi:hypothetical protein
MKIEIGKAPAVRAASLLYHRWIDTPLVRDVTIPMGVPYENPIYACCTYLNSVAQITGLSKDSRENTVSTPYEDTIIGM